MLDKLHQEDMIEEIKSKQDEEINKHQSGNMNIVAGYVATESARVSTQQAVQKFSKPDLYTGNRHLFDDGTAKRNAKLAEFKSGEKVFDSYTGEELVLTIKEAKVLYGENWQKHLAESDHVIPLEKIFEETKDNPWLTTDDIKKIGNSNIKVTSRAFNNKKRSRTNEDVVKNEIIENLSEEGKQAALRDGITAKVKKSYLEIKTSEKNILKTGHEAGMSGAKVSGSMVLTMSGIMNTVALIKGEKDIGEAFSDTLTDSGKATVTGYVMSGGLTAISNTLTGSSSKFLQALSKSNVPGKVITAVMTVGDTFKRYGNGEISTQQCLLELGDKGLNLATAGYSMLMGQELIPIPIVGAAVGALVGSVLTSSLFQGLIKRLQVKELEHQERQRIIAECNEASKQLRAFRKELESYLETYFKEYKDCFNDALAEIQIAFQMGDVDGVIAGTNQITKKLGGQVYYGTVKEFKQFLNDDSIDIL